ncbi:uncharacterized protein LOC113302883 isoform X2 [Papaver somniferum]|uniref:uncharacterized protein LOC113302883 isoform X2 n=1 Tax=Papaver somniferum TaxID=3469 RepID=UPI000E705FBA|nr:uncharacterized protein LOC113302883 isoform X2 [Papaver somniferum]
MSADIIIFIQSLLAKNKVITLTPDMKLLLVMQLMWTLILEFWLEKVGYRPNHIRDPTKKCLFIRASFQLGVVVLSNYGEGSACSKYNEIPSTLASVDTFERYTQLSSDPLRKTSKPGILFIDIHPSKLSCSSHS